MSWVVGGGKWQLGHNKPRETATGRLVSTHDTCASFSDPRQDQDLDGPHGGSAPAGCSELLGSLEKAFIFP